MTYLPYIIIFFLSTILASALLTRILIPFMISIKAVDKPSARRAHKRVTPRGGGLAIVFAYCFFLPIFEYLAIGGFGYSPIILQIFVPIALISFWDDIMGVNISLRLAIHILSSLLAVMWLVHPNLIMYDNLPVYFDLIVGALAIATFLNIFNFMDGIDGLSASESIHLCLTIMLLCILRGEIINNVGFVKPTVLIIMGASIGFLIFNWHPAKIFLGDVGSISIGFLLGLCLIIVASSSGHLFLACVIASLYYVADGGMTIMIRIANGEKVWQPHLKHFFQRAVKNGKTPKMVLIRIIRCNFFLMLLSLNSLYYPVISTILAILTVTYTLIRLPK